MSKNSLTDKIDRRTYLAGQALAGYMATIEPRADTLLQLFSEERHASAVGQMCAMIADAVIRALDQEPVAMPAETVPPSSSITPEFPEVP